MEEIAYKARDNTIDLQLLADGAAIDGAVITRTKLKLVGPDSQTVDSNVNPDVFEWGENGVLILALGSLALTPGRYWAQVIVYDGDHPNGLVWGKPFALMIEDV